MRVSIIIPVGDLKEWESCKSFLDRSFAAYTGAVEKEVLPCFDLEHKGAYVARNEGLRRATGDWIAWVDCDDRVEEAWFPTICRELEKNATTTDGAGFDILVFGIVQEKDGVAKVLYTPDVHEMEGEAYARWMLGGKGMPHWLWHRVFRRELWKNVMFEGRVKQDYQGSLQVLPRVKRVRFIPDVLYRYIRHGHGLSNYVQQMDYGEACEGFLRLVENLPPGWRDEARMGIGLLMSDVILHDPRVRGINKYVRPYFWRILFGGGMSLRFRVKALLASLMMWK